MLMIPVKARFIAVLVFAALRLTAQDGVTEKLDLKVLHEIKNQAFLHTQVMDDMFYISEVYGPRVTSSPNHRAAAEWAVKRLQSYGVQNVHLEPWCTRRSKNRPCDAALAE